MVAFRDKLPARGLADWTCTIRTVPKNRRAEQRFLTPFLPQLFLKGRRIRAAVVDQAIHGPDPFTPEEFASEYQVPLEAVLEVICTVAQNRPLIEQERDHEEARLYAPGSRRASAGMRFLVDENLSSPRLASPLRAQKQDAVLASDVEYLSVTDARVLIFAIAQALPVLTRDSEDLEKPA